MKYEKTPAPKDLATMSLARLCDLWETASIAEQSENLPTVRGWLMDEIERRNPSGLDAWLEQDAPEDEDLRYYVMKG